MNNIEIAQEGLGSPQKFGDTKNINELTSFEKFKDRIKYSDDTEPQDAGMLNLVDFLAYTNDDK
jgi:hypothetical protein